MVYIVCTLVLCLQSSKMRRRFISQAFCALLLYATVLQAYQAKPADDCSSSCGNTLNISYPFRLKGDLPNCGYQRYELSCEGGQPYLYLHSRKYSVIAIEYKKKIIRILDYGLQSGNYSSVSLHTLISNELEYGDPYIATDSHAVTYVNCSVSVDSVLFIPINSCFNSSTCTYLYAILPSMANVSDLLPSCKVVAKVNTLMRRSQRARKYNYTEFHDMMMKGFELSWDTPLACYDCVERNLSCSIYQQQGEVRQFVRKGGHLKKFDHCYKGLPSNYFRQALGHIIAWFLMERTTLGILCLVTVLVYKLRTKQAWMDTAVEEFLMRYRHQTPTRYSYSDIREMTKRFSDKLGQGGFGSVYKGELETGQPVAIKILSAKAKGNGQEFINEVATTGRIHHVNVIRLIGFCAEGSERALIYEFMPNGSLEKYIYNQEGKSCPLSWEKMWEIALGIARGIEYLHRGCDMKILHFDIKPHNILLDEKFTPKVSDFGLAKFYPLDKSIASITTARGTMGYIAPEVFYNNVRGVSCKSDVYSFGMLLMEMAGRRKNFDARAKNSSQFYFPSWIHAQLYQGKDIGMEGAGEDEKEATKKMLLVGLWCTQMKPADRPSMTRVVEMLEGSLEQLQLPAKPFPSSPERAPEEDPESDADCPESSSVYESGSTLEIDAKSSAIL